MANTALAISDIETNLSSYVGQMRDITARKREQIKKLPKELSKAEREARAESIRTAPVAFKEAYVMPEKAWLKNSRIVTHKKQLKEIALTKTVVTGEKHEPQEPFTLGQYLDALYLSIWGHRDGDVSLMYRYKKKVFNDFMHPTRPYKYEKVDAVVTASHMFWDREKLLRHTHTRRTLYHTLNTFKFSPIFLKYGGNFLWRTV